MKPSSISSHFSAAVSTSLMVLAKMAAPDSTSSLQRWTLLQEAAQWSGVLMGGGDTNRKTKTTVRSGQIKNVFSVCFITRLSSSSSPPPQTLTTRRCQQRWRSRRNPAGTWLCGDVRRTRRCAGGWCPRRWQCSDSPPGKERRRIDEHIVPLHANNTDSRSI